MFSFKKTLFCLTTPIALLGVSQVSWADDYQDAQDLNTPNISKYTVPVEGSGTDPFAKKVPSFTALVVGAAGIGASSNTLGGTTASAALDLFSLRRASIGKGGERKIYNYEADGTPNFGDKSWGYPTHAVEIDVTLPLGQRIKDDAVTVGIEGRLRVFVGGTNVDRATGGHGWYGGGSGRAEGSIHRLSRGNNQLLVGVGPEGGWMYQGDHVMLQVGGALDLGNTLLGTDDALDKEIDTGSNAISGGGRMRLLVDDRLYFSAEAMHDLPLADGLDDWMSMHGSFDAQIRAGKWTFMGRIQHIRMRDPSGASVDVRGTAGRLMLGRQWW